MDYSNNLITVNKMKNRKTQIIPMSKTLCEILQEYLQYKNGERSDYLFVQLQVQRHQENHIRMHLQDITNQEVL